MSWQALGTICEFKYGSSLPANARQGDDYPVYGSNGVVGRNARPLTNGPTIIVGRKGSIGEVNYSEGPCWPIDTTYFIDASASKVDLRWLSHALSGLRLGDLNKATGVPGLNRNDAYERKLFVPQTIDEQKRIAAILDQADELRRKRQRVFERLGQLGQAIFHEMFGDFGTLPRTHSFAEVAKIQQSLVDPKTGANSQKFHVGPEHIASNSGFVDWRRVRTAEEDGVISGKNEFSTGSILYSKIRPYLNKVAIADRPGICSADMYVINAVDGVARNQFLLSLLMGRDFLAYAETCSNRANIPKLNRSQVESYRFFCPPFNEQTEFSRRFDAVAAEKLTHARVANLQEALFEAIQHRAFQGVL